MGTGESTTEGRIEHHHASRYIYEKKEFKQEIQTLRDDLSARQPKIDDLESKLCRDFDEYDSRTQELSALNLELNTTVQVLTDKLEAASSSNNETMKSLNAEVTVLCEELTQSLAKTEVVESEKDDLEVQLCEARKALADSEHLREEATKMAQEELSQLQADLQVALAARDEREAENHTLSMSVSQMNAEITELERVKRVRQQMLDNISDFGPRVYRRWNLPRDFARKVAEWVSMNKDK